MAATAGKQGARSRPRGDKARGANGPTEAVDYATATTDHATKKAGHPANKAAHPIGKAGHPIAKAGYPIAKADHPANERRSPREPPATGALAGWTIFLDRDGVLVPLPRFGLRTPRRLTLLPGASEAVARLCKAGATTCLVTNQPWVGLLTATPGMVRRVHDELQARLRAAGGRLDRVEASFAPPGTGHRRRKPKPGMLKDAAAAFASMGHLVDPARSVMVGDSLRDALAAQRFGIRAILLAPEARREALQARFSASLGGRIREGEAEGGRAQAALTFHDDLAAAVDDLLAGGR